MPHAQILMEVTSVLANWHWLEMAQLALVSISVCWHVNHDNDAKISFSVSAVTCHSLNISGNVLMSNNANVYGSRRQFSCHPGYTLQGSKNRRCRLNGTWSGQTASCTSTCGWLRGFYLSRFSSKVKRALFTVKFRPVLSFTGFSISQVAWIFQRGK